MAHFETSGDGTGYEGIFDYGIDRTEVPTEADARKVARWLASETPDHLIDC